MDTSQNLTVVALRIDGGPPTNDQSRFQPICFSGLPWYRALGKTAEKS